MRVSLIVLSLLLLLLACATSNRSADADVIEGRGTVQFVELEGGFYGIVADDGQRYDPTNLDEAYEEDGLRVRFRARERDDLISVRMWGRMVEIISIERI